MLTPPNGTAIYLAAKPVNFRKGADNLVPLVRAVLTCDPMQGTAVVFHLKRADHVKIVVWDGSGLVLYWRRLESGTFESPPIVAGAMRMNAAQRAILFAGMDWTRLHAPADAEAKALA
jgi:transposase